MEQFANPHILAIRQKIVEIGREILAGSLTVGTWGNISSRVPGTDYFAITPSGMDYKTLEPGDVVIVDLRGNQAAGLRRPSIEVPLHLALYEAREDVRSIVHTHSPYATAMAAARKEIPGVVEDLVQIVGGGVRVSEYALPGTRQLGMNTVRALAGRNAALLANHGMLGVGGDLDEALRVCQVVEKAAQIVLLAQLVGGAVPLSREDINSMRDFYLKGYGQDG